MNIMHMLGIALGAAIGANLRYVVSLWAIERYGPEFPYGTLLVNLVGCLLIGVVLELHVGRVPLTVGWRAFLVTGFLGGLTTFSSFSYEIVKLYEQGFRLAALFYIAVSLIGGIVAVVLGTVLVRSLAT